MVITDQGVRHTPQAVVTAKQGPRAARAVLAQTAASWVTLQEVQHHVTSSARHHRYLAHILH